MKGLLDGVRTRRGTCGRSGLRPFRPGPRGPDFKDVVRLRHQGIPRLDRRRGSHLCPGLCLKHVWSGSVAADLEKEDAFAGCVRERIRQAMDILGQTGRRAHSVAMTTL